MPDMMVTAKEKEETGRAQQQRVRGDGRILGRGAEANAAADDRSGHPWPRHEKDEDDEDEDDEGDDTCVDSSSRGSAGADVDADPTPTADRHHHGDRMGRSDDEEEESTTGGTMRDESNQRRDNDDNDEMVSSHERSKSKKPKVHKLSLAKTEDFNEKLRKRGVVYVARIPPRMTPTKIKSLLGEHGEVTRAYLVEEDAAVRRKRRKLNGGNGSKRYTEGWVEFAQKSTAKHVAASLNGTAITNYKRSPHYGDLWSLKYLSKFKWSHLTEKVAYERRVREQKLRLETMQARRDTAAYKQLVETGLKLDKIEERKRRREERVAATAQGDEGGTKGTGGGGSGESRDNKKKPEKYKPRQVSQIDAETSQRPSKKPLLGSLL